MTDAQTTLFQFFFQVLAQGYPKGKVGAVVEIARTITQGRIFGHHWLTKSS